MASIRIYNDNEYYAFGTKLIGSRTCQKWYRRITFGKNKSPDFLAIELLGHIIAWYVPKPNNNGQYVSSLKGDEWYFAPDVLAQEYGVSKRKMQYALAHLMTRQLIRTTGNLTHRRINYAPNWANVSYYSDIEIDDNIFEPIPNAQADGKPLNLDGFVCNSLRTTYEKQLISSVQQLAHILSSKVVYYTEVSNVNPNGFTTNSLKKKEKKNKKKKRTKNANHTQDPKPLHTSQNPSDVPKSEPQPSAPEPELENSNLPVWLSEFYNANDFKYLPRFEVQYTNSSLQAAFKRFSEQGLIILLKRVEQYCHDNPNYVHDKKTLWRVVYTFGRNFDKYEPIIQNVIEHFNSKMQQDYSLENPVFRKNLKRWLGRGKQPQDFITVIEYWYLRWYGTKYQGGLTPKKLFGDEFETLLIKANQANNDKGNTETNPIDQLFSSVDKAWKN